MKTTYKLILLVILACTCSIIIYYTVDKVKPVKKVEDLLAIQNNLEEKFKESNNYTFEEPNIIVNPYGISPLTALIIFETKDLTTPTITIIGKDEKTTYTHTFTPGKKHYLPVYGLYADTENTIILNVNNKKNTLKIKTDPLPENFVLPTKIEKNEKELNNELFFFTPSSTGYTSAYDINGDVRWYLTENFIWDIKRLDNGHLLLSSNRLINPPYYTTGLVEIDLLGKIYYEYNLPGGYHHDVFELDNGNLIVASDNFIDGTVEDYVVEIDRNTGKIVKEIDLKNILDTDDGNNIYTTDYDWFHNNSVWYDEKTNSLTLSGRHKDAVINIDYNSNELNWIIGDNNNWSEKYQKYFFKPSNDLEWQYAQHAAMILPDGNVFIFDNGNNRSKTETKVNANNNYSRGVIYKIDNTNKTVEQIWQYGKEQGSNFYSPYISDVDYITNNHYLISSGGFSSYKGTVSNNPAGLAPNDKLNSITVEIKDNKEIFRIELPTNTYRSEKMSLYANDKYELGKGKRLGNMGETQTNGSTPFIIFNKTSKKIDDRFNISITKEIDRLVVKGTFKKDDKVEIILDSLFNKKAYNVVISKKPYTAMCVDVFNEEEEKNGITVTKYINDIGLDGKYYLYLKINGTVYDMNQYINY